MVVMVAVAMIVAMIVVVIVVVVVVVMMVMGHGGALLFSASLSNVSSSYRFKEKFAMRRTIGWLSRETGCRVPTIRYYEQIGLLPEPERTDGNQRLYTRDHLARLAFIRHSRDLGFSLDAVRELLDMARHPEGSCAEANAIARRHLDDVNDRIARLNALRVELARMVACDGETVAECRVIEILADHGKCLAADHVHPHDHE